MKLNPPTLDKWVQFNDVLVGEAINYPGIDQRKRVMTTKIGKFIDGDYVQLLDGEIWKLGQKGHLGMYVDPVSRRLFFTP